jgi:hypothetical protein
MCDISEKVEGGRKTQHKENFLVSSTKYISFYVANLCGGGGKKRREEKTSAKYKTMIIFHVSELFFSPLWSQQNLIHKIIHEKGARRKS